MCTHFLALCVYTHTKRSPDRPIAMLLGYNYTKNEDKIVYDSESQPHGQRIVAARHSDIIITGQQKQLKTRIFFPKGNYIPEKCKHR